MKRTGKALVSVTLQELLHLKKSARQFSLSAFKVRNRNNGQHSSRLLARGMEFAESRCYLPGDDIRNIDWRVTARTGKAHTKLFAAEKERQVVIAVDMRSSMYFATRGVFKSVQASLIAGHLGWSVVDHGDRLGSIIFDELAVFESKPALGTRGVLPLLHNLDERKKALADDQVASLLSKTTAFDRAVERMSKMANHGSLIFIISDFRHLTAYAKNLIVQMSLKSDVCLIFLYDPLEAQFPKNGLYPVTDEKVQYQLNAYDKKNLENYEKQFFERRNNVAFLANQSRITFIECSTENDCLNELKKYF